MSTDESGSHSRWQGPSDGGILTGVTVLDFTHVLSGPFATMVLGDLGAKIIKVEKVAGDETRHSAFRIGNYSEQFAVINRNKLSVAIDLSTTEGPKLVRDLIKKVDVVVENFRPGAMDRLGLGPDALRALHPMLIYCGISAFGAHGVGRERGGFDLVAQAASGLMSVTGTREGEVVKAGIPVSDFVAGLYATTLICGALYRRQLSGSGEVIDVSLVHSAMSLLVWEMAQLWSTGEIPGPLGTAHRNRAPYQAFAARDGRFILGAGNEGTWLALCAALNRPDLAADSRFSTNPARMQHQGILVGILAAIFVTNTVDYWVTLLTHFGCPASSILDVDGAFASDHAVDRNMTRWVESPEGERLPTIGFPYGLTNHPPEIRRRPPGLGEHTDHTLRELLELDDERLASLKQRGVLGGS